ncbi:MAG: hypothetical protein ACREMO_11020 [Gemmatimonadales bacterium]
MFGRLSVASIILTLSSLPQPALAQSIAADILIRQGAVAGRLTFGQPNSYYHRPVVVYRRPAPRRVIVVERYAPRGVLVQRFRARGHPHGYWQRHGFRQVVLFYDYDRNVYYDRYDAGGPGIREVGGYEREGRFYRDLQDRGERE